MGSAQLNTPHGVAADAAGNFFLADTGNDRVREGQPGGNLFTVGGNGNASYFGDGSAATRGSVNQGRKASRWTRRATSTSRTPWIMWCAR